MAFRLLIKRSQKAVPASGSRYSSLHSYYSARNAFNFQMLGGSIGSRCFSVDIVKLEMPALSPTMSEGTIAKWLKKEGDKVDVGDVVCEIQTDKATIGYESQEEGYIAKILSAEGVVSPIGGLIGVMVEEEEDIGKVDVAALQSEASAASAAKEVPQEAAKAPTPEPPKATQA